MDCRNIEFSLSEGLFLICKILDSCSQERTRSITNRYLPKIHGCMVIYDITDFKSFDECKNYCRNAILENCKGDIKVMLIGNKADLEDERKVSKEEGLKFAEENNYLFRETSCLNLDSVVEAFETLIIETFKSIKNKDDLIK